MSPLSLPFPQGLPPSSAEASTPVRRTTSSNKSWEVVTGVHEEGEQREGDVDMSMIESRSEDSSVLLESSGVTSEEDDPDLPPLHIEVRLSPGCSIRHDLLRQLVKTHLLNEYDTLLTNSQIDDWKEVAVLLPCIERIWVAECSLPSSAVALVHVVLTIHLYYSSPTPAISFSTSSAPSSSSPSSDDGEDSDVMAASVLTLPSKSIEGIWDSLVYEGDVKGNLLRYVGSTLEFSDAGVDFDLVTWNRVVLLHGPPGTGKTSLCRALAHKLAVRLSNRYESGKLIEINSHSLFSKWFSESGKLVGRLFAAVTEMVDDENCFVVVLIDEVESLTAARAGAMEGKEPSDALRVVNALLTQLDKLKHRKNCLVVTTSNLSTAIDGAFIDRADIKQYIGLPPPQAVYWILQSCLQEIMRAGLIPPLEIMNWQATEAYKSSGSTPTTPSQTSSLKLYSLSHLCSGMSGRTLRRLPVLAHAKYIGMRTNKVRLESWLKAMEKCMKDQEVDLEKVEGRI